MRTPDTITLSSTLALAMALARPASAQTDTATATTAGDAAPAAAPYSLPFGLRGVAPVNVVRVDTVLAFANPTTSLPVLVTASYKVIPDLAILARWGVVQNAPKNGKGGFALTNAAVGGIYGLKLTPDLKLGLFLGFTIPFGSGGGNEPDANRRTAVLSGMPARSALDNAMFAVNYLTIFPGIDLAYVAHGFTLQAEVTSLFLIRVRGDEVDKDAFRLNLTIGLHAGYFLNSAVSFATEIRYQVWLANDTVKAVADNPAADNLTFAVGPRFHIKSGDTWLRPGISLAYGLDDPMANQAYTLVQLDVPFFF
ncbi:MAG: hypothetical protein IT384_15550 [Deltaproteobacteria bacterium]|nr:hypothetical protein [Deltaproteobacteria bacterium]